jgi:hypothetical protein
VSSAGGPPSRTPQISPDGRWIWDGKQWLPVANPSSRPLQVSPDGKWVWDGTRWLPIAQPPPAVFPAWSVIAEEATAPAPHRAVELEPIPVIGDEEEDEPEINPYLYAQPEPGRPAWDTPQTGLNKYMYVAVGVVVLVMAAIVLNSLGPIQLPWMAADTVVPRPSPTPPVSDRTDAALADQVLTGYLGPAFANLNKSAAIVNEVCTGLLVMSCRDDIRDADSQVKNVLTVSSQHPGPDCIAAPMARLVTDLAKMDDAFKLALQGYKDNQTGELAQGLNAYRAAAQAVASDRAVASALQKTVCNPQVVGP